MTRDLLSEKEFSLACPIPIDKYPYVLLAHGGGGKLMHQLIEKMFVGGFHSSAGQHDSAVLDFPKGKLAFTTDSYVVQPLFFPGGNIGDLAVNGTVNDLAMSGARPLYLSCGFILEEGLPMETLWAIVRSMRGAADKAGVKIVTGDTKVVDKSKGDGVFINTAGVGAVEHDLTIAPSAVRKGDVILVNGDLGRHGIAIMAVRENLSFEGAVDSDTAALWPVVQDLLKAGVDIHCLRDLTRGGIVSALNEIALSAGVSMNIEEIAVPVREDVRGACEILGLDPLYVANEGRFVAFVAAKDADRALLIMKKHCQSQQPAVIGTVTDHGRALVTMNSHIGVSRILDMISGEQLPRIC